MQPDFTAYGVHPADGKVCVKAYGLVQKTYHPHRILTPMKRTNPRKGRAEDPGFVPISWDDALDIIAEKLNAVRADGLLDANGYPRVAASIGGGGTAPAYMGTFPAFLSAWGPIDQSLGSGQGVKCRHSEHLYGELWHRAFTVAADTPLAEYIVSFGLNTDASGGVCGVRRHADARARGAIRIQLEPHLSVTGASASEWLPIRPKTDPAFMFAMLHVLLHECGEERLDHDFLSRHTASPYLVAPNGYYLRAADSSKPLVWDNAGERAVPYDTSDCRPALSGTFVAGGIEIGADDERWVHEATGVETAFTKLVNHVRDYTPEWASEICDLPAEKIRRVALDFLEHARIGETIEIDGHTLPLRPVAITMGKTVNNGWGGFECCWARTVLATLVGALEVPGGTLGTSIRLNRPMSSRLDSVKPGPDGFMDYPMNPTDRENWTANPEVRHAYRMLVPLVGRSGWSQALGPTHLAWMMLKDGMHDKTRPSPFPDVWFVYRTNPAISFWDTDSVTDILKDFPFTVAFAYTRDETNYMADILLPESTDLESLQLIRIGGTKFEEQFWDHKGVALRQPVVEPRGECRDFTWIAGELARRTGLLREYNSAINRGSAGIRLQGENYDFSLDVGKEHSVDEIWDAACRAASAELTGGEESEGLEWYKMHGFRTAPQSRLEWYLFPRLVDKGLRFELPYQERLLRVGTELGNRLHEQGIGWWDKQLEEYAGLPQWKDYPGIWERALADNYGVDMSEYPFWVLTARSMQYSWGANTSLQVMKEISDNVAGHGGVVLNPETAASVGIEEGDLVEVRSPLNATRGEAVIRAGIRPDTLLILGQFEHWATPFAKDLKQPSMNKLVPMLYDLTDSTGSSADLVRAQLKRVPDTPAAGNSAKSWLSQLLPASRGRLRSRQEATS